MSQNAPLKVLRVDASARQESSTSRALSSQILKALEKRNPMQVRERDLSQDLPFINEKWIGANFTMADERTPAHEGFLSLSDLLISEVENADILLLSVPIYNFFVPASLKNWIDHVVRPRKTFRYTDDGPIGLLPEGKKAVITLAAGGTVLGSERDFALPYLRHILSFIGIKDITVLKANRHGADANIHLDGTEAQIEALSDYLAGITNSFKQDIAA